MTINHPLPEVSCKSVPHRMMMRKEKEGPVQHVWLELVNDLKSVIKDPFDITLLVTHYTTGVKLWSSRATI